MNWPPTAWVPKINIPDFEDGVTTFFGTAEPSPLVGKRSKTSSALTCNTPAISKRLGTDGDRYARSRGPVRGCARSRPQSRADLFSACSRPLKTTM